ncbi:MAG TPA: type I DNA topoisomerase [Thermoanaerobaculia bacterium]|nr:type I DNA topoisomerase [Thermoanaerobaculia bacterium]
MASSKGTQLVIVESPAKANTIGRFLGKGFRVEASYGHVRDLPQNAAEIPAGARNEEWARLGVNIEKDFEPLYVIPAEKKKHVKRLKDALEEADQLLLATDEDREGESISWHILQVLKPPKGLQVGRIVFHEVTKEAIDEALARPRAVDEKLVRAQEARRVLDRLYGYTLSPLLWKRVAPGLSAGRVQSVAVRLTVLREWERIRFKTSSFWDLKALLDTGQGSFEARLVRIGDRRLADARSFDSATGQLGDRARLVLDQAAAAAFANSARSSEPWQVASLERSPGVQRPAPPFTTSTLQQEANRKLKYAAQRTMRLAQQLYEGVDLSGERVGLITYMRTDSTTLAGRAIEQARRVIADGYGSEFLPEAPVHYKTKAKRAQEAHEAIRPTDLARRPQDVAKYLDPDQARLYELIWKRTIACQMLPARFERTAVEVSVPAKGPDGRTSALTFAASGRRITFPGFLRAYVEGSDDPEAELGDQETILPPLEERQRLDARSVEAEGHETRPPMRYTEASLVKRLEEEGIGRPSTYATIIGTIQDRGYVWKRGNELIPTFTAFCVTQLLEEHFGDLVDTQFTARMEDELDEVAAGEREWIALLRDFYHGGTETGLLQRLENLKLGFPAVPVGDDPRTGEKLLVKIGRFGPYLVRGEGGKGNTVTLPDQTPPDELTTERALALLDGKANAATPIAIDPATGRSITVQVGRFGPYLELGLADGEEGKPKRVSLPKDLAPEAVTAEVAHRLVSLPRIVGRHPDTGEEISAGLGRFGPYLKHGEEFRNLSSWQDACEIGLDAALVRLAQPKGGGRARRAAAEPTVLKELGQLPGAAGMVRLLAGRYGPYVTDGKVNASLPKGNSPDELTAELAVELLAAKRAAGKPAKRRLRGRS